MEVISLQQNYKEKIVLCLGFFDCMHLGHIELLNCAKKMAKNRAKVALFTFCNNHFQTLQRPTKLIYTFEERLGIYESLGIDLVVSVQFDEQFKNLRGEEFLAQLQTNLNLAGVVCGADFTCGGNLIDAKGVSRLLQGVCPVEIVQLVHRSEKKVCSTLVRELLLKNQIEGANSLLSQPFFFEGVVAHGRHVGHNLGFPTANLPIPLEKIAPQGVYLGKVEVENEVFRAIVNIGNTPTFNQTEQKVEAHLLNFNGDLYGKKIKISLLKFLRTVQKFEDEKQLIQQLQSDIEQWNRVKI